MDALCKGHAAVLVFHQFRGDVSYPEIRAAKPRLNQQLSLGLSSECHSSGIFLEIFFFPELLTFWTLRFSFHVFKGEKKTPKNKKTTLPAFPLIFPGFFNDHHWGDHKKTNPYLGMAAPHWKNGIERSPVEFSGRFQMRAESKLG